jgi:hypothetical protein
MSTTEIIHHAKGVSFHNAVRRWLEMTRDFDSLDVCSLFDDRVLQLDSHPSPPCPGGRSSSTRPDDSEAAARPVQP